MTKKKHTVQDKTSPGAAEVPAGASGGPDGHTPARDADIDNIKNEIEKFLAADGHKEHVHKKEQGKENISDEELNRAYYRRVYSQLSDFEDEIPGIDISKVFPEYIKGTDSEDLVYEALKRVSSLEAMDNADLVGILDILYVLASSKFTLSAEMLVEPIGNLARMWVSLEENGNDYVKAAAEAGDKLYMTQAEDTVEKELVRLDGIRATMDQEEHNFGTVIHSWGHVQEDLMQSLRRLSVAVYYEVVHSWLDEAARDKKPTKPLDSLTPREQEIVERITDQAFPFRFEDLINSACHLALLRTERGLPLIPTCHRIAIVLCRSIRVLEEKWLETVDPNSSTSSTEAWCPDRASRVVHIYMSRNWGMRLDLYDPLCGCWAMLQATAGEAVRKMRVDNFDQWYESSRLVDIWVHSLRRTVEARRPDLFDGPVTKLP